MCHQLPKTVHELRWFLLLQCLLFVMCFQSFISANETRKDVLKPTVMIAILARNKAHALPYFFGYLERLNYPRNRIALWYVSVVSFYILYHGRLSYSQPVAAVSTREPSRQIFSARSPPKNYDFFIVSHSY